MTPHTMIKIRKSGNRINVLVFVNHPMVNGGEKKHYIEQMTFEVNRKTAAEIQLSPMVARNPLTAVTLEKVKSGDTIHVRWRDNRGGSGGAMARVV